jgi:hypothetical protein
MASWPPGEQAIAGCAPLAYNGKTAVYSQWISRRLWGYALEGERRIIDLCYKHGQNISYMEAEIIGSYFEEML